uniref:B-cell receptor CD22 n=1 Tax=Amphiprion percula TaxID=161767 RepID=A0A3P8SRE0_AMPPE
MSVSKVWISPLTPEELIIFSDVLCVSVVQGDTDYRVTYSSTQICALQGSAVDIRCTYTYPSRIKEKVTVVEEAVWFTKMNRDEPIDLMTDSQFAGRVQYRCDKNSCTLKITDLRNSDSAEYKFMFRTNQPGWIMIGSPGVTLSVTALQVKVTDTSFWYPSWAEVTCSSSCHLSDHGFYVWYMNGETLHTKTPSTDKYFEKSDSIACAVKRYENFPSPSLYPSKLPSMSVSPSGEIVEGSSVTLTCSSDANPEAENTLYKGNQSLPLGSGGTYHFTSISSEDRGFYDCKSDDQSVSLFMDVLYAPKLLSVSVNPSAETVEGSSVNLTCSSDANPAATYTWYKEDEDSPLYSGQIFTITDFRAEHSGNYYCEAQNTRGRHNSTVYLNVASSKLQLT